jgi:hypothetical protein
MKIEEMTPELIEKAKACKTTEELMKFFMENHISLPDEYLENVSGGVGNADEFDLYPYWRDHNGVLREIR